MIKIIFYTCKDCEFLWTKDCPIRVWGRNEGRREKYEQGIREKGMDVNPKKDFCSKFKGRRKWAGIL